MSRNVYSFSSLVSFFKKFVVDEEPNWLSSNDGGNVSKFDHWDIIIIYIMALPDTKGKEDKIIDKIIRIKKKK